MRQNVTSAFCEGCSLRRRKLWHVLTQRSTAGDKCLGRYLQAESALQSDSGCGAVTKWSEGCSSLPLMPTQHRVSE
jgi:hypothetical protein